MRLWHKDLLPYLPKQQLVSQWRECCCIAKNISVSGTPNHILVNRILEYPERHFVCYAGMVCDVMQCRGYNVNTEKFLQHTTYNSVFVGVSDLFANWHDDIYLRQCLYNLEEKYICNGISKEEWQRIYDRFGDFTPLVK